MHQGLAAILLCHIISSRVMKAIVQEIETQKFQKERACEYADRISAYARQFNTESGS